jgi:zinc transport system permease protein
VRVGLLNTTVAVLAALTIGISMRVVGILLIAALMALPVLAAQRVAWSLRSTLGIAMGIGLASVLCGLVVSYYGDLAPGGTVVLVAAGAFVVAALVEARPRIG